MRPQSCRAGKEPGVAQPLAGIARAAKSEHCDVIGRAPVALDVARIEHQLPDRFFNKDQKGLR
jgi:hypothetical protein